MRFDSPLQLFERTAVEDSDINGVLIKKDQKIAALLGSANRDEKVFDNPDQINLLRTPNNHIAFGGGIHFCLGAPLARLEMNRSIPAIFARFPGIKIRENPVLRSNFVLRGYSEILVSS